MTHNKLEYNKVWAAAMQVKSTQLLNYVAVRYTIILVSIACLDKLVKSRHASVVVLCSWSCVSRVTES